MSPSPPAEPSTENQPRFSGSVQGRELELGMFPRIFPFLQQKLRYQGCVQELRWQHGARQLREPSFLGRGRGLRSRQSLPRRHRGRAGLRRGRGRLRCREGAARGRRGLRTPTGVLAPAGGRLGRAAPSPQASLPPAPGYHCPTAITAPSPWPPACGHRCPQPRSHPCSQPTALLGFTPHGEGRPLGAP